MKPSYLQSELESAPGQFDLLYLFADSLAERGEWYAPGMKTVSGFGRAPESFSRLWYYWPLGVLNSIAGGFADTLAASGNTFTSAFGAYITLAKDLSNAQAKDGSR